MMLNLLKQVLANKLNRNNYTSREREIIRSKLTEDLRKAQIEKTVPVSESPDPEFELIKYSGHFKELQHQQN